MNCGEEGGGADGLSLGRRCQPNARTPGVHAPATPNAPFQLPGSICLPPVCVLSCFFFLVFAY